jgi:hypothetical protein
VNKHLEALRACVLNLKEAPQGIDRNTEDELKKKFRGSDEAKWKHIYCIIFPDVSESEIPSPCKLLVL